MQVRHGEARGAASYNPDGSVAAVNEQDHFPAIEILRVPECYDRSSVLNIFVGAKSDQTGFQMELPALHQFLGANGLAGFWNAAPLHFPRTFRRDPLHSVSQIPISVQ